VIILAAIVVGLVGVASIAIVVADDGDDPPSRWDPRVARFVPFVESHRGLKFKHPVPVVFMSEAEFREEVSGSNNDLTDDEREDIESYEKLFRALGLLEPGLDLFEEYDELDQAGTLAFFDQYDERIVIRGTEITLGLEVTIVHELTHALQHQHFDLTRFDDDESTSGQYTGFTTLIEGDAQRIEYEYINSFDDAELAAFEEEYAATFDAASIDDAPPILTAFFGLPYEFGDALTAVLAFEGGNSAVNKAFRRPPSSEEHLLDPWSFLQTDEPIEVKTPKLRDGEEEIDHDDFGALTWYLMLAERIDPRQALEAADGWGGDAYVLFEDGAVTCTRVAFRGDRDQDGNEMAAAARAWAKEMPDGIASVSRNGKLVLVESCDPGAESDLEVPGLSGDLLGLPLTRIFIALGQIGEGASVEEGKCTGAEFVDRLSDEQVLTISEFLYAAEPDPEFEDILGEAAQACGRA